MQSLRRILIPCFLIFLGSFSLHAQEQIGLRVSNFSGVNSMMLNPAQVLVSRQGWDVNLMSGYFFIENNYAYIQDASALELLRSGGSAKIKPIFSENGGGPTGPNTYALNFSNDDQTRFIGLAGGVMGPSFMVSHPSGHSFGAFLNGRVAFGARRIPNPLSYYKYENQPLFETFTIEPFELAMLAWGELGLNYGFRFPTYNGNEIGFAVTLKAIQGYETVYFENQVPIEFTRFPEDTVFSNVVSFRYGYTRSNLDAPPLNISGNGLGAGFDFGVIYTTEGPNDNYEWRLGASIMDVGAIRFNQNAARHQAVSDREIQFVSSEYNFVDSPEDLDAIVRKFSSDVLGDESDSFVSDVAQVWLPAALSVQIDYNFNDLFYLNATLVQGISVGGVSVERGNLLAITPRVEHRWFEAGLPVSFYNYRDVNIGLFGRLGPLVLGSENLGSLFTKSNLTGTDFYIGLRVPYFPIEQRAGRIGKVKNSSVKCYDF
jgi:hypothetical protein